MANINKTDLRKLIVELSTVEYIDDKLKKRLLETLWELYDNMKEVTGE